MVSNKLLPGGKRQECIEHCKQKKEQERNKKSETSARAGCRHLRQRRDEDIKYADNNQNDEYRLGSQPH
ncbi:MAG: hypothetical protein DMG62_19695 [Acidobacteria bacterium]|nr:MAG: hypothetical protein DMG62_19695 [Acidobacteriota bacterium]